MSGYNPYSGTRTISDRGDSAGVTIPAQGLDEHDLQKDDVVGMDVPTKVENGEMRVDLEALAKEVHGD